MWRTLTVLLIVSSVCPSLPSRAASAGETIRVGIFSAKPVVFMDGRGQADGIYVDLLEEIARHEDWQIEYVPGSWNDGLSRAKAGEIDLMTSVAYLPQRDEFLDYSQESVLNIWGEVYVTPQSPVENVLDLKQQAVAVMKGDINGGNFKKLAKSFGLNCSYIELGSQAEVLGAVADGRARAGVVSNVYGTYHAPVHGLVKSSIIFNAFSVYFAGPEGENQELLATIDAYLKGWKADKGSPYHRIVNYWLSGERGSTFLPRWLLWTLVGLFFAALLFAIWVWVLRVQVAARTRALRESEERYRGIFNSTTDAIFIHRAESGKVIDVNEPMLEMFGVSWQEAVSSSVNELSLGQSPYSQKEAADYIKAAGQGTPQLFEWRCRKKDGTIFWTEVALRGFAMGEERLVSAVVRDISDRKRLEEQIAQSQKMEAMGTLAGGIAHDFNNILTGIIGFSELALLNDDCQGGLRQHIEEVLKGAHRAKELVRQILAFSRKSEHEKKPLQVAKVVKEALQLLRSTIPSSVKIEQDIGCDRFAKADPVQILQVVMNLCTNAAHAMEENGGILRVALSEQEVDGQGPGTKALAPGPYIRLAVQDNGRGMDGATLEKIFDPYFTTKEAGKGTGLGMAVVHGIVQSHQGDIFVHSEPGLGTSFQVYLPICSQQGPDEGSDSGESLPASGTERLMVVDDEALILDFSQMALSEFGYKVSTFLDPAEALAEFGQNPDSYDLMISDMTMPGINGLELIDRIREIRASLPIILCSGYSDDPRLKGLSDNPLNAFCQKPVAVPELLEIVRKMLDKGAKLD
ncbi:MAG: ATP-binding protein [Thermodesulfobacteriota bacterium]